MTIETLRPRFQRLAARLARRSVLLAAAAIMILIGAYALAGFYLVPRLIIRHVPRYASEQLKRRAEIGEVRFNPFLFKLEIKRFRLQEADGRPLLAFDRLFVDFEGTSVVRRAWTFADIQLDAPRVDAVLERDGRVNLLELLASMGLYDPAAPPRAAPAPRPVLLARTVVRDGQVTFTDLTGQAPHTASMRPINVELRDVTTVAERRGPYAIAATLGDGGVVGWTGDISLFPLRSTGRLGIREFPVATAWRFVQDRLALAEPAGRLHGEVGYRFTQREGKTTLDVENVEVTVDGLVLTRRGDPGPLLALDKIRLAAGRGDLIARELTIPEITVSRGRIAATRTRDGTVNWQTLVAAPATPAAPAPADASPWRVAVERVRVEEVALALTDQGRPSPVDLDVGALTLALSARIESGPTGLAGTVDGIDVKLERVGVRETAARSIPLITNDQVSLAGGRVDLGARQVTASRFTVTGGTTVLKRPADGSLPLLTKLGIVDDGKSPRPAPRPPTSPRPAAGEKVWTVAVDEVGLIDHRLAFTDESVTPAVDLQVEGITVNLRRLRTDSKQPMPFDASFRVAQGGRLTASGLAAPDGESVEAKITLSRFALTPAQPLLAKYLAAVLRSGDASTSGRVTYRRADAGRAVVTYTGAADVDNLLIVDAAGGERVLGWKSLHAETVRFGLAPDRLAIDEVRLSGLEGKIVIDKDKTLSVAKLMKPAPAAAAPAPAPTKAPPSAASSPDATFPLAIERVRIEGGSVDFADLSLALPFAARIHELKGVVVGVGTDPSTRATVKLDGRVDESGLVKVDGTVSPSQPKVFTDLVVVFRNVQMTPLTPYSATFVGRRIAAGTLDLNLEYKIDGGALVGDNKVVVRRLQLGERVEGPGATRLPLDLAIAILSDSQGVIDLELPVRGNVDSPEFAYGHLIWQALVTVITKIATAPFRALGALFGGGSENVGDIGFEAGSDTVRPPEREKLKRVTEVLGKRPRLKLTVHGRWEPKADGEALRSLHVRRDLARLLEVKVDPGEDPGPVAFDRPKSQRALERLWGERGADIKEFQATYEKTTGKKAERFSQVLVMVNRGAGDSAFYQALFQRLVETTPLADAELTDLARRRGEAAARTLKDGGAGTADRVAVGAVEAADRAEQNTVTTRLELGADTGS